MKLLDLFCGAGGAAMGYYRAGFDEITGIDNRPMPRYPFDFIQTDALGYLAGLIDSGRVAEYDLIHASPPCQAYSILGSMPHVNPDEHPDLVEATRELLVASGRPYVIENVTGAPLDNPLLLCGSSFGLRVRKHRLFETSLFLLAPPCQHDWQDKTPIYTVRNHGKSQPTGVVYVFGTGGGKANGHWKSAMGIDWMSRDELAQAIPPAYTEWLGRQMMAVTE